MISFTKYMNKSLNFRNHLQNYSLAKGHKAQEIRKAFNMLSVIDTKSKDDTDYRENVFNWFEGKTSTIELREFCKIVGFDYWGDLDNGDKIDLFDSVSCYIWNLINIKNYKL